MPTELCLPKSTRDLIEGVDVADRHPGLQLDKLSGEHPANEHQQKEALKQVCKTRGFPEVFPSLLDRWKRNLAALRTTFFNCQTTGPLTLHLSRASALENAGICLHPIYGFVYLPGSGLKGMARAYAETVWKHDDKNKDKLHLMEEVFGNQPGEKRKEKQHAGSIVFHDAWPTEWPQPELDIVNNHHPKYYQGKDNNDAPGDWENPVPVNFLAIGAGNTFTFAMGKRRHDVDDSLFDLAREWLIGALCHMEAGAKTNAGYGSFKVVDGKPGNVTEVEKSRATYSATLELVTPAFLAGAGQDGSDCDLRPATLRGLLRWWWRTMHAGYVDVKTLRAMEAAIWGDTNSSGAVRITVKPISVFKERYDKCSKIAGDYEKPKNKKTTQGLFYNSFGMHDGGRQRWYAAPSSKWMVNILARKTSKEIPQSLVRDQAKAALYLLCHFGGVGSKSRKGFGSFMDLNDLSVDECIRLAHDFRDKWGCDNKIEHDADSPALNNKLFEEIPTPWIDYWYALDQLGFAVQTFAQKYKHNLEKKALGLPRNVRPPHT